MIGYVNGEKIYLNENLPINYGKNGEDLNALNTTQIRVYKFGLNSVKNTPLNIGSWFSVELIMQDQSNGMMLLFADAEKIFFRVIQGGNWRNWHEITYK